jgi:hypothetical protein
VKIAHNVIRIDYGTAVRDYARGNLDEAELWAELSELGYNSFEIEWHIANPGQRMSRGSLMDDELKELFFDAIDNRNRQRRYLTSAPVTACVVSTTRKKTTTTGAAQIGTNLLY